MNNSLTTGSDKGINSNQPNPSGSNNSQHPYSQHLHISQYPVVPTRKFLIKEKSMIRITQMIRVLYKKKLWKKHQLPNASELVSLLSQEFPECKFKIFDIMKPLLQLKKMHNSPIYSSVQQAHSVSDLDLLSNEDLGLNYELPHTPLSKEARHFDDLGDDGFSVCDVKLSPKL